MLLTFAGCGGCGAPADAPGAGPTATEATDPDTPQSPQDAIADAMDQIQDAFGEDGRRASAPVNFRDLRALVPEEAAGLTRTEIEGATEGAMGMSVSRVASAFEDDAGFERTTEFEGLRAYEEVRGDYAELQVIVAGRFLVSAEGRVPMDTIKDLLRAHGLAALAAMRNVNVEA